MDFCNAICIFGYCNVWAFGVVGRTRIIVSEVGLLSYVIYQVDLGK